MKIAVILLFGSLSLLSFGQKKDEVKMVQRIGPTNEATYIIVMDSSQINVDYDAVEKLNKKWIKDLRILKDSESQAIYGHQNGVMLISIKPRYSKRVLRHIKNQ